MDITCFWNTFPEADPGFQVRGGVHFKKLHRPEGGVKIFGVFRVKNLDFTPKNHIFFNLRGTYSIIISEILVHLLSGLRKIVKDTYLLLFFST